MGAPIEEIYRRYEVPPNLRRHLLRVAAVAERLCRAWRGPAVDRDRLIRALLLHDVGNIVKADYEAFPEMLEEERANVARWAAVQARYRARFGRDEERATRALAEEIGLDEGGLRLLGRMSFLRNDRTAAGEDYEAKIAAYADQRVGPYGVVSLRERFAEIRGRYGGDPGAFMLSPRAAELMGHAFRIEAQLFERCDLSPEAIDDRSVAPLLEELREFVIGRE